MAAALPGPAVGPVRDIQSFVKILRADRDLVEIEAPVETRLELAEIHRRVIAAGGPALLFKRPVRGDVAYEMPVATNLFGTPRRAERAFGRRPIDFVNTAVRLVHEMVPPTLGKLWGYRGFFGQALRIGMNPLAFGPVRDVLEPDTSRLPLFHSWPDDGGDFVTLPLVYTEHPENRSHNLGMYRVQRHAPGMLGMHWQIGKGGGFHHHLARQRGEALPTTVFVGGPPAMVLSAIAPLPENVPELLLASLLVGERLRVTNNPGHPHRLIADAEVAIFGHVPPHEMHPEGPFGDHYGYYSLKHDYPVVRVDGVYRRRDAIWPATVVGKPRQEDLYIGDYLQELLSPLFPLVMPSVKDLWSYGESGHHALASAVVQERYKREAVSAALRVLGEGQLSLTKFLWVVDGRVDLRKPREVLPYLLARFRPETDLFVIANVSMDTLDYSGPAVNEGSKGIMLGVGEPWRSLPQAFSGDLPVGVRGVSVFCPGVLCVSAPAWAEEPGAAARLARSFPDWPLVVLCDDAQVATRTDARFLWTTFTRFEPAADIHAANQRIARNHVVFEGTITIDARMKPTYPAEVTADPETVALVTRRWKEYFPQGNVEMGDASQGHLDAL